jgi:hypothetical protein
MRLIGVWPRASIPLKNEPLIYCTGWEKALRLFIHCFHGDTGRDWFDDDHRGKAGQDVSGSIMTAAMGVAASNIQSNLWDSSLRGSEFQRSDTVGSPRCQFSLVVRCGSIRRLNQPVLLCVLAAWRETKL